MVSITGVWLSMLGFLFVFSGSLSLFFLSGAIKNRTPEQRSLRLYYIGLFAFLACVTAAGVIHFVYNFYRLVLGITLWEGVTGTAQNLYFYILVSLLQLGFVFLSFQIERHVRQSKHYPFTIELTICFAISLVPYFLPAGSSLYDTVVIYLVNGTLAGFAAALAYWGIFYLRMGAQSAGVVKKRCYAAAFGLAFYFFGIILDLLIRVRLGMVPETNLFLSIGALVISCVGIPLLLYGFQRKV